MGSYNIFHIVALIGLYMFFFSNMKILKVFIYTTVLIVTTHYEPLQRNLKRIESVGFFPTFGTAVTFPFETG